MIKLYNTLTRKKEVFTLIKKNEVGMYSCGPTVYSYPHVGNHKTYIFSDLLKRMLIYNGLKVKHVINVTDVGHLTSDSDSGEDKMENAAKKEGKSAGAIADFYFNVFKEDLKKLNIISPSIWCKATEHINEQIELIKKLEKKGYIYKTTDGIYFDSSKFSDYGKLAKIKVKGLKAGKRVALGEKKNKTDFALWKFSPEPGKRQQEWKFLGREGFPGWHIECSAMSSKYLGKQFDIHTGGEDHIQIHHTNEIAQSECATGKKFVNYWLHGAFLLNKGEKVSKSKGGLYTISELEELGYKPVHFRYLCLLTYYRKPLNFSLENLDAAKATYEKIRRKVIESRKQEHKGNDFSKEYEGEFVKAINDDLNIPEAIQLFLKALDNFDFEPKKKIKFLENCDRVLGIGVGEMREVSFVIPKDVKKLVADREKVRQEKKWEEADILRQRIKDKGYAVEDSSSRTRIEKIG